MRGCSDGMCGGCLRCLSLQGYSADDERDGCDHPDRQRLGVGRSRCLDCGRVLYDESAFDGRNENK